MLTNLWKSKVTIYNDIPATAAEERHFDRFVIEKCSIQGGLVSKADGTVENIVNAITVFTKDVARYRDARKYATIPVDMREQLYTVQIGDFVVLDEVDDIVNDASDYAALRKKYADNGFKVNSVSPYIHGMAVDNISFSNT